MGEQLVWVFFGILIGWIASLANGADHLPGQLAYIAAGVIGAMLGGYIMELSLGQGVREMNEMSFSLALIGATLAVTTLNKYKRTRSV